MWRVALSIAAIVLDTVALAFLALGLLGLTVFRSGDDNSGGGTAGANQGAPDSNLVALIFISIMVLTLIVNILAIGFGARLRSRASDSLVASEFS